MQFGFGMPQRFFTEEMGISVLRPLLEKVESLGYHRCLMLPFALSRSP